MTSNSFSEQDVGSIIASLPVSLQNLAITAPIHHNKRDLPVPATTFRSLTRLILLQALQWEIRYTYITCADLLFVLNSCPALDRLILHFVKWSQCTTFPTSTSGRFLVELDLLEGGNNLNETTLMIIIGLHNIQDMTGPLPRLETLRFHAQQDGDVTHNTLTNLVYLCPNLKILDVHGTIPQSAHLFLFPDPWPCVQSLEFVRLKISPALIPNPLPMGIFAAMAASPTFLSPIEQEQVWTHFSRLINIRALFLTAGLHLTFMPDMHFAIHIQEALIVIPVPPEDLQQGQDHLETMLAEWNNTQPEGWHVTIQPPGFDIPHAFFQIVFGTG